MDAPYVITSSTILIPTQENQNTTVGAAVLNSDSLARGSGSFSQTRIVNDIIARVVTPVLNDVPANFRYTGKLISNCHQSSLMLILSRDDARRTSRRR
jgi:hypothetical protein